MGSRNRRRGDRREPNRLTSPPAPQSAPQPPAPHVTAPTPSGHHVATFARPAYRRNEWNQELRIAVDSFQGSRPYVSLRYWKQNPDTGDWWPTQTGVTIRLAEGDEVLEAIGTALNLAENSAIVAKIRGQGTPPVRVGKCPPAPARTNATYPGIATSQRQTADRRSTTAPAAPWKGPDQFTRPDAALSSDPGFDEDPPF